MAGLDPQRGESYPDGVPRVLPSVCLSLFVLCGFVLIARAAGSPEQVQPSAFDHLERDIFSPKCGVHGCHIGSTSVMGMDLRMGNAWYSLVGRYSREMDSSGISSFFIVAPGDPENSYLYRKIKGDDRIIGDQMPLQGDCLTDAEVESIRQWIANGAMPPRLSKPIEENIIRIKVGVPKTNKAVGDE